MADLSRFTPTSAASDEEVIPMEISKLKREVRELQNPLWVSFGPNWRMGPDANGDLVAVHYPSGQVTPIAFAP